ncbi:MAG: DUF2085 domain-containing protein [Candidatus Promineifilaceae bacterium]
MSSSRIYRTTNWISCHWLATFNSFVGMYVLLPLLAPVLLMNGFDRPANWLYTIYAPTCHQMAFRSVFIGGEQTVYPREHAHTLQNVTSFEEYAQHLEAFHEVSLTGLGADLMISARRFTGNNEMGYKSAICQRDLMIFGGVFAGGLIFAVLSKRRHIKPLPIWAFIIFGMGPIGLDGFSQLFSYYIPQLAFRESPPFLRLGTGLVFGLAVAWLALPHLASGMRD